jgi:hypothetical protein
MFDAYQQLGRYLGEQANKARVRWPVDGAMATVMAWQASRSTRDRRGP